MAWVQPGDTPPRSPYLKKALGYPGPGYRNSIHQHGRGERGKASGARLTFSQGMHGNIQITDAAPFFAHHRNDTAKSFQYQLP